jgi:hypothetical protein
VRTANPELLECNKAGAKIVQRSLIQSNSTKKRVPQIKTTNIVRPFLLKDILLTFFTFFFFYELKLD